MNGPTVWQKTWTRAVGAGVHTIRIVHASGGPYVDIDAIKIE